MIDWRKRAKSMDHKPDPVDVIPDELHSLGEVFFPIPKLRKGWNYPHGSEDYRFSPDSETLNAYLEAGWGYGIACAGDLVVVDIDEMDYINEVTDGLPETIYQVTGSRQGVHFFYLVEGMNNRQILNDGDVHVGEIKCDPHGYVVGPGSLHPSGNKYGPLEGDEIAEVPIQDLLYQLNNLLKDSDDSAYREGKDQYSKAGNISPDKVPDLYTVSAHEVTPALTPNERIAHPVHGSSTGSNFMMNDGGQTYTCWRCQHGSGDGCVLAPVQYLAVKGVGNTSDTVCEDVKESWRTDDRLHFYAWEQAVEDGIISPDDFPFRVLKGYGVERGIIEPGEDLDYEDYNTLEEAIKWEYCAPHGDHSSDSDDSSTETR